MNHPMRRKDRALSREEAFEVLKRCEVCRLAFSDEPAPYLVPMNFGVAEEAGETVLYFPLRAGRAEAPAAREESPRLL